MISLFASLYHTGYFDGTTRPTRCTPDPGRSFMQRGSIRLCAAKRASFIRFNCREAKSAILSVGTLLLLESRPIEPAYQANVSQLCSLRLRNHG